MRWLLLGAALLAAAACSKAKPTPPDAGQWVRRSTDLRTAVLTAMPEFRETRILSGSATLRRTVAGAPSALEADVKKALAHHGWTEEPRVAGQKTLAGAKDPFRLEVEPQAGGAELRLSLPVRDGDPARMLASPTSISTEQLALYFPRLEGTAPVRERFEVALEYESFASRTQFLVWQLVYLSTRGPWKLARVPEGFELALKPDGGVGDVPERVSLALEDSTTGARVTVERDGKRVQLEYQLDTLAPR